MIGDYFFLSLSLSHRYRVVRAEVKQTVSYGPKLALILRDDDVPLEERIAAEDDGDENFGNFLYFLSDSFTKEPRSSILQRMIEEPGGLYFYLETVRIYGTIEVPIYQFDRGDAERDSEEQKARNAVKMKREEEDVPPLPPTKKMRKK